jgi:hypothetical protein
MHPNATGFRIGLGGAKIGRAELAAGLSLKPTGEAIIRYYLAGFGRTAVAAGAALAANTGNITRPFRGERFVVTSDVASSFQITQLQAGSDPVIVSPNGIPARIFVEMATDVCLEFATITGVTISVNGTNIAGAAATFEGAVLGYAAVLN